MRIRISVAVIALLSLTSLTAYFCLARRTGEQKEADARKKLVFESLVERLPKGRPIPPTKALDAESKQRWAILDEDLAFSQERRAKLLQALHEKTHKFFVESPGAGPARGMGETPEMILMDEYEEAAGAMNQPGEPAGFPTSPGEPLSRVEPNDEFYGYHKGSLWNFLYPSGFGYVKDRAHVAGFRPHGFRHLGMAVHESWRWRIQHIHLLGILSHAAPVVYLTDKLPSMEQIRQGNTRPLDFFEEAALPALREGEDLFIASKGETLRMLGALRATKTCQQCHDAEVGDLLGAFSYTLRLAPWAKKGEEH